MARKKSDPAGKRGLAPHHPGTMWRRIIKDGLGISIMEAAERMDVSRGQLTRITKGTHPVTPNFAFRFARLCDKKPEGAEVWLRLQLTYDVWAAQKEHKQVARRVRPVTTRQQEKIATAAMA